MGFNTRKYGELGRAMGRRGTSLLLFVAGYLAMASLAPLVALVPALLAFFLGVLVLVREPEEAPAR
jgi:hypothetical protein